jgi:hypothetical protein
VGDFGAVLEPTPPPPTPLPQGEGEKVYFLQSAASDMPIGGCTSSGIGQT